MRSAHCFGSWNDEREIYSCAARIVSGRGMMNEIFSALVSGHGLKNEIYSCVVRIVSGHGMTNEKYIHVQHA